MHDKLAHFIEARLRRKKFTIITAENVTMCYFPTTHGGKTRALEAARVVRDKMEKKLKPYTRRELANKATERTTSGHRGVRIRTTTVIKAKRKYIYEHAEASWSLEPGKVVKKSFSVEKLGRRKAWELAMECRRRAVPKIRS